MYQMILAVLLAAAPSTPAPVAISNFQFRPATLKIVAGQTVRFVNRDGEAHTVTATDRSFDSGGLDSGDSWTHRFTRPGRYAYICALHPFMRGTIIVLPKRRS